MTKTLLIIQSLLTDDLDTFHFKIGIIAITWLLVAIAIVMDLASGVHKAKERGEMRTSYGFKQTVHKGVLYYAFMLFAFMFDCIGMFFYPLPVVTFVAASFLIFIECKSVFEKAHDKDKRKFSKNLQQLSILLQNKDDLARGLLELVKKQIEEQKTNDDGNN